jgi:hypothetical protein
MVVERISGGVAGADAAVAQRFLARFSAKPQAAIMPSQRLRAVIGSPAGVRPSKRQSPLVQELRGNRHENSAGKIFEI